MDGYAGKGHQVLLIDDDSEFCELMTDYLDVHSFAVSSVHTGTAGIEAARRQEYDVILLDMLLPDSSGIEVLRHLRTETRAPVVILSAHNEETDRIVTLELGADDYVPKAFSPRELLARVRAVLRRAQPVQAERKEPEEDGVVRVRGLWMDRKSMKARMDGVPMDLTALEFRIMFGMAAHPGRVFTRENLLELAVGREFSRYDRSVDMHISTLRRKLGDDPHNPAYLKTIRGMGYTLLPEEA